MLLSMVPAHRESFINQRWLSLHKTNHVAAACGAFDPLPCTCEAHGSAVFPVLLMGTLRPKERPSFSQERECESWGLNSGS